MKSRMLRVIGLILIIWQVSVLTLPSIYNVTHPAEEAIQLSQQDRDLVNSLFKPTDADIKESLNMAENLSAQHKELMAKWRATLDDAVAYQDTNAIFTKLKEQANDYSLIYSKALSENITIPIDKQEFVAEMAIEFGIASNKEINIL